jgi:hypothetical protein
MEETQARADDVIRCCGSEWTKAVEVEDTAGG